jgi:predicted ribosomally synthesized peptide with nif11-like leader
MDAETMKALRLAIDGDPSLQDRFAAAASEAELIVLAQEAGVILESGALTPGDELSEAELESVSGGYTFPPTDWIYCDNPWTNAYCTLKCVA